MTADAGCVFCRIVTGEIPCTKLLEDDATLAFMDINPANEGHCLVIPKAHAASVLEIDDDAIAAVARSARRVACAVHAALRPPGLNLVQANGPAAAQSVGHFHIHVLPRMDHDRLLLNWPATPGDLGAIAAVAERIRAQLQGDD
jgi:histidine triad (HIT) family protein